MKIVLISNWFSENMGYSENFLPKALGDLEQDVHLISSTAQIYYKSRIYKETYEPHLGPPIVYPIEKKIATFTLHRLEISEIPRKLYNPLGFSGLSIKGLFEKLVNLNPDVVQVFDVWDYSSFIAAKYCKEYNKRFFTESHMHASVLRKSNRKGWREIVPSFLNDFRSSLKLINQETILCYPISEDVAEICLNVFKVPKEKLKIQSLGVDTQIFYPVTSESDLSNRKDIRKKLGFEENDIVSIYTGRFSPSKNPQILANAIDIIHSRGFTNFKGLFVGNGTGEEITYIKSKQGCTVHPFVLVNELPPFYRASEIGVWPREESTSQLDAAACGLPIIISKNVKVTERAEGNGLYYIENDCNDLADKILSLADIQQRHKMSEIGLEKIQSLFSWKFIAKSRLEDYINAEI